jgi:hypothetical protein
MRAVGWILCGMGEHFVFVGIGYLRGEIGRVLAWGGGCKLLCNVCEMSEYFALLGLCFP